MAWIRKRGNRYHVQYRDENGRTQAASTHVRKLDADRALIEVDTTDGKSMNARELESDHAEAMTATAQ